MNQVQKVNENRKTLLARALFMLLFLCVWEAIKVLTWLIAIVQIISSAAYGHPNARLISLGQSLAIYLHQIADFVYFVSPQKPFPFNDWPK